MTGGTHWGTPQPVLIACFAIPYAVTYLSFDPSTRLLRQALLLLGIGATGWMIMTFRYTKADDSQLFEAMIFGNLSASITYALTRSPPTFHPLPRRPPLGFLRDTRAFRAFNLLISDMRHINIPPNPPLKPGRNYIHSITHHLISGIIYTSLFDFCLYSTSRLLPHFFSIQSIPMDLGDLPTACKLLAKRYGDGFVPWWIFWAFCSASELSAIGCAMQGTYHLTAFLGIGSGIYLDEEWPSLMNQPWRSDSLNDLWGKRYHQTLRDILLLWSTPFSTLPRPFHLLSTFIASAIFHALIYRPLAGHFTLTPHITYFGLSGVGCILERQWYKLTGRKVRGWAGRIWTWSVMIAASWWMVNEHYKIGWVGLMREGVRGEKSPAEWAVHLLGLGARPGAVI